jgi:hypothetical protein
MKEGDIIICDNKSVNDNYTTDGLTIGKKYKIYAIITFSDSLLIFNDFGNRYHYSKNNFITFDEYREEQINKIFKI